jgi:tRNA-dihydrouridine synthase
MKLALAPMATLSHEALRVLIHRYGDPDEYFSEMIHAPSFIAGGRFEEWYVRTAPAPERMVWQLTGHTADLMSRAAALLVPFGGIGIDLNMGCCAPDIARSGAGIAWMLKDEAEVAGMVRAVRSSIDSAPGRRLRLSVKLRLGADEDYPRLLGFCRMLVGEGTELITLHPRLKSDKYSRPARRAFVGRLAADLSVPVYGNGDVHSAEDAREYAAAHPSAGLMLGRFAVQKPWIFRQIRDPGIASREPVVVDHLEVARFFLAELAARQPPEFQLSRAHRFFWYYSDNFSFAHHVRSRVRNTTSPGEIADVIADYLDQVPQDRYLSV